MQTEGIVPVGESRQCYSGRLWRITEQEFRFPNGTTQTFERAERAPGVRILVTDGSHMLLTKEWRAEQQGWDYRLPGGKVCDSIDEFVEHSRADSNRMRDLVRIAAKKELREETALDLPIEQFREYHRSLCGATVLWDVFYFTVHQEKVSEYVGQITTAEGEEIQPCWVPFDEVERLCIGGQVNEDRTVGVLLRYLLSVSRGQAAQ